MACETCRSHARVLARAALRAGTAGASARTTSFAPRLRLGGGTPARQLSGTAARNIFAGIGAKIAEPYRVLGTTEKLYKICAAPADYHITKEERKNDEVKKMEDGEEVGHPVRKDNIWHKAFNLQPTFSTWSHVTMLHLYLINARLRCFDREACRNWQQQLVDHFFFQCEQKMHVEHNINSSALRQRYLKDIFVQWRGLLLAYDEGIVKGDAILASAVWRNLFKGAPDVDPRALAAIVGWMRSGLKSLEASSDANMPFRAEEVLKTPVGAFWRKLEEGFRKELGEQEAKESGKAKPKASASATVPPTTDVNLGL